MFPVRGSVSIRALKAWPGAIPSSPRVPGCHTRIPMPFRRCPGPADLEAALAEAGDAERILLFFGSEQAASGVSWCPDCVTADPVLRAALVRQRPELVVLECPVGERADWKGRADHPYRRDLRLAVHRIPTLIRWSAGRACDRLVEGGCADPAQLAAFLAP